MKSNKRKRCEYKQYWSRDGPQEIPRSTKHSRESASAKHVVRDTRPLQEESSSDSDEFFNEDPSDIPVVSVLVNYEQHKAATLSHPDMIENDLPPVMEIGQDDSSPVRAPDVENSSNEQDNSFNVGLAEVDQSNSPAHDNSFDNGFCCNFNVDDDCVSEEEASRLLWENPMPINPTNAELSIHSSPVNADPQSPQSDSSSDSDDEIAAIAPQLHLTIREKIKMLLLLATKKRHNLSYSAAENIFELANVMSQEDESSAFLPSKHCMKRTIDLYSFALREHHICPVCGFYIGIVVRLSFYCSKCDKTFITLTNRVSGNMFLYLSMEEQLRTLFENCLSKDTIIDTRSREKINQHNYEDLFDGAFYKKNILPEFLTLNFFIDGVQIGTTTKTSAWPILVSLNELPLHLRRKYLMMASMWLSKEKPRCNEYLKPFVHECIKLQTEGMRYKRNGENCLQKFKVCVCVSDSVARPPLRNCNQFNGRNGCGLCYHPGIRMAFGRGFIRSYSTHERSYPLRTHEETIRYGRQAEQTAAKHIRGIKGHAILSNIPGFDIVKQLDPDSFHCLVNVGKRFAWLWFGEKFHNEPFNIHRRLSEVDTRLLKITPTSDVSRFRSLKERSDYRGHEWYHWIMVYSIPCLKTILPNKYLNHWSKLSTGLALLMQNSVAKSEVVYANRYLNSFVSEIDNLYGAQHVTFSVHLLTHLAKSVEDFGQPWCHSAFIYEAANAEIKNLVKSSNGAIFQISKGIQLKAALKKLEFEVRHEMNSKEKEYLNKMLTTVVAPKPHCFVENASLLGKPDIKILQPDVLRAMRRAGVVLDEMIPHPVYLRCIVNNELFHSSQYTKAKKQNNSVASLEDGSIFIFDSFVVPGSGDKCFALGHFIMEDKQTKLCDPVPPHLKILKNNPESTLRCIPISDILSKLISFSVEVSRTDTLRLAFVNVLSMEFLK